jgi:hypothetical protein
MQMQMQIQEWLGLLLPTILEECRESASISIKETPEDVDMEPPIMPKLSPATGWERERESFALRFRPTTGFGTSDTKRPRLCSWWWKLDCCGQLGVGMAAPFDIWCDMGMRVTEGGHA